MKPSWAMKSALEQRGFEISKAVSLTAVTIGMTIGPVRAILLRSGTHAGGRASLLSSEALTESSQISKD